MKNVFKALGIITILVLIFPSCTYKLSLNGSTIPLELKTLKVEFFENNAALVVNTLSNSFTEALKDRIRNTSRLSIVRVGEADAVMSGSITDYSIAPASVAATTGGAVPLANANRLTITVNVKYVINLEKYKKDSFEQSFSKFEDFKGDINSQEPALIADITKELTEDIFNKAFDNW